MSEISFRVEPQDDLVVVRVRGALTVQGVAREISALAVSHPTPCRLWDLRGADLTALSADDLRSMAVASRDQPPPGPRRVAALVAADADYGISRMFEALAEIDARREYAVFRAEDDARAWLRGAP